MANVKADYVHQSAQVTYDPTRLTPEHMVEAINARTFYRASLPGPGEPTPTVAAAGRANLLPFAAGGILLLLAGVGVWRFFERRRASQATQVRTSP